MKHLPRVLLIEDDAEQAEALKGALESTKVVVEIARNGTEGLEKALRAVPDLVICDIGLPDFDGDEVARQMRADPKLRSVRLLALSVNSLPEDCERSKRAGFDERLVKPPSFDALEKQIAAVRGRHP